MARFECARAASVVSHHQNCLVVRDTTHPTRHTHTHICTYTHTHNNNNNPDTRVGSFYSACDPVLYAGVLWCWQLRLQMFALLFARAATALKAENHGWRAQHLCACCTRVACVRASVRSLPCNPCTQLANTNNDKQYNVSCHNQCARVSSCAECTPQLAAVASVAGIPSERGILCAPSTHGSSAVATLPRVNVPLRVRPAYCAKSSNGALYRPGAANARGALRL